MKEFLFTFIITSLGYLIPMGFQSTETVYGIGAIIGGVLGLVGAGVGAASSASTSRRNEFLAGQAREDELERRARASEEYARAIEAYQDIVDQRPSLQFKDWLNELVEQFGNEELIAQFNEISESSWEQAQELANRASEANVDTFAVVADAVSGGRARELVDKRNELILDTDLQARFERARELSAPNILADSFVEGEPSSRANKQEFQVALEEVERFEDKQITNINDAIRADRSLALSQQEKSTSFLDLVNPQDDITAIFADAKAAQVQQQRLDETFQAALAQDFARSAFTDQTGSPTFQDDKGAALFAQGLDTAARSFSNANIKKEVDGE